MDNLHKIIVVFSNSYDKLFIDLTIRHNPYHNYACLCSYISLPYFNKSRDFLHKGPITIPKCQLSQWWMWTGGIFSLVIVLATIIIPSKISYTTFLGSFNRYCFFNNWRGISKKIEAITSSH